MTHFMLFMGLSMSPARKQTKIIQMTTEFSVPIGYQETAIRRLVQEALTKMVLDAPIDDPLGGLSSIHILTFKEVR